MSPSAPGRWGAASASWTHGSRPSPANVAAAPAVAPARSTSRLVIGSDTAPPSLAGSVRATIPAARAVVRRSAQRRGTGAAAALAAGATGGRGATSGRPSSLATGVVGAGSGPLMAERSSGRTSSTDTGRQNSC